MSIARTNIKNAFASALAAITTANGYYTDFGGVNDPSSNPTGRIFRNRIQPLLAEELPALTIRATKNTAYPQEMRGTDLQQSNKLEIEVGVVCTAGTVSEDTVDKMVIDAMKAIKADRSLGGTVVYTYYTADELVFVSAQQEKIVAGAIINFYVLYNTASLSES